MADSNSTDQTSLLSQVQGVTAALDQAFVAIRKRDTDDPQREKIIANAVNAMVRLIIDQGEVIIRFTEAWPLLEVRLGAYPVPNPALTQLGRKAFKKGLRALRLRENVDTAEAAKLLEVLGSTSFGTEREDPTNDLITMLWEADLRTVILETGGQSFEPTRGDNNRETFLSFTENSVVDEIRTPLLLRAGIYLIWSLEDDPARKDRVTPVFTEVLSSLVNRSDLTGAVELLRELDKARGLAEDALRALQSALLPFRANKWLESTVPILDSLGDPPVVAEFFRRLGPGCVPILVNGLRRLDAADTLFDVLVNLATLDARPFRETLLLSEPKLQSDILRVLSEVKDPAVAHLARPILKSTHPQLRALALKVLARAPIEDVRNSIWSALVDREVQVRITATRILAAKGTKEDQEALWKVAQGRVFWRRGIQEKQTTLEALARIGGEDALPILRDLLVEPRGDDHIAEETQICVARALRWIPGEGAKELLKLGGQADSPALTQACLDSLHDAKKAPRPGD